MKVIIFKVAITCVAIAILFSCSKSPKDFAGEYQTCYTSKVSFNNSSTFFPSKGFIEVVNGFTAYELSKINFKLYLDQSSGNITGEGQLRTPYLAPYSYSYLSKRITVDFSLRGFELRNDTLFFNIEPMKKNIRYKAYLVKQGNSSTIGIDENLNSSEVNSPFFLRHNGSFDDFIANDIALNKKSKDFIIKEFFNNDSLINLKSTSERDKKMLMNANAYYNKAITDY